MPLIRPQQPFQSAHEQTGVRVQLQMRRALPTNAGWNVIRLCVYIARLDEQTIANLFCPSPFAEVAQQQQQSTSRALSPLYSTFTKEHVAPPPKHLANLNAQHIGTTQQLVDVFCCWMVFV